MFFGFLAFLVFLRFFIASSDISGDLRYYVGETGIQTTRLGLDKKDLFFFLEPFSGTNLRIAVLSLVMSFLFLHAAFSVHKTNRAHVNLTFWIFVLGSLFHAQLDMHLVRMHIALYLFLLVMFGLSGIKKMLILPVLLYHEAFIVVTLVLAAANVTYALTGRKFCQLLLPALMFLIILILATETEIFFISAPAVFCLIFFACFKLSKEYTSLYLFQILLLLLPLLFYSLELIPVVNLSRFIGLHVSLSLFLIAFLPSYRAGMSRVGVPAVFLLQMAYIAKYAANF